MNKNILIFLIILLFSSCSDKKGAKSGNAVSSNKSDTVSELPFPEIPEGMTDPEDRANFIITHFWDEMNFEDVSLSRNAAFIEQNFVNFISFAPYASENVFRDAVRRLLKNAKADTEAYELLAKTSDIYLYDPESPTLSEDLYKVFVEEMLADPFPDESSRERQIMQLEQINKNRPGMKAADFSYMLPSGNPQTLWQTRSGNRLLLIFYDPDCDHCKEIMDTLASHPDVNKMLDDGSLSILAVYSGDNKDLWVSGLKTLPSKWIIGYNDGDILDNDTYVLRASPTMYLLDADKNVIAKDIQLHQLIGN